MTILHIDFETYSACDLRSAGLANYAADPSTGVHCMAYATDDGVVDLWVPGMMSPDCLELIESGALVYAHNAAFELAVWNQIMAPRYGWPTLLPEQCRCTMAMAYAMALPGALENAAPALNITQRKDAAGKRIMLKWCRPRMDGTFWKPEDDPEQFKALCDYCVQDVEVERALTKRIFNLSDPEQKLWALDYKINQRGIRVDLPAIDKAIALVNQEKKRLDQEMLLVTGGSVGKCTEVALMVQWIRLQGVEVPGLAKADVLDALSGELPDNVRRALELRKEAAKSSTAKLLAMKERASEDGRVRGAHQFHGASTGRWAGRGVQLQNLPRGRGLKPKAIQELIDLFNNPEKLDMFYGPVMDAVADGIRGMIIPAPGHDFIAMDFSSIEARGLAWLAGEDHVLRTFASGEDIYKAAASRIYSVPIPEVTKDQRQIGKVATLALGYGGGVGAFQSMARNYSIVIADDEADQIKLAWRAAHPNIKNYWFDLEHAGIDALRTGGTHTAGPVGREVAFRKKGSFLWCRLPSGRVLCYPYPEVRAMETPWGEKDSLTYMTVVSNIKAKVQPDPAASSNWKRIATYGGSLAENVTQAVARDLLAEAMIRLESNGFSIVAHVHDEVVVEVETRCDTHTLSRIEGLMAEVPTWATGLPLAAEGWRGTRYRK